MTAGKITALIVDDEPPALRKLRRFLSKDHEVEIVGEAGGGREAIDKIRALSPDVVFLDIQMGEIDGFGVVEALAADRLPAIVFVTAHDDYALKAFEVAALDYLLKPFDAGRFAQALGRAKERARAGADAGLEERVRSLLAHVGGPAGGSRRILVKKRDRSVLVKVDDIAWVRAAGNYVELHVDQEEHLIRETLDGMGRQLDPQTFLRVHRSFLVNAEHIREIRPWSHGDHVVVMQDGTQIRLSRRYRRRLPAAIGRNL